jgi:hypothetical protein
LFFSLLIFSIYFNKYYAKSRIYLCAKNTQIPNSGAKLIEFIFDELRLIGAVKSSDNFSMHWLGRERSYMRSLREKRREPSAQVLATVP